MPNTNSYKVFKELERDILSGYFKPRERLIEMDLISRFGVSRTVIREVFKMLEAKGLIKASPYRGVVVLDLSYEEIEELYFLRVKLEKIAAKLIIKNITEEEIKKIKHYLKELEKQFKEKSPYMIEADSEFHRMINQACKNRYLSEIIDLLRTKAHIVRFNAWSIPDRIGKSMKEHREILKAIEKRDLPKFEKLIVKHLTYSKESYMAQLKGGELTKKRIRGFKK